MSAEEQKQLLEAVTRVAKHMAGWSVDPDSASWQSIVMRCDAITKPCGIHVRCEGKRLDISGLYPQYARPDYEKQPHITVGMNRDPAAVAADIERRFISEYLPLYRTSLERLEQYRCGVDRANAVLDELAAILGCDVSEYAQIQRDGRIYGGRMKIVVSWTGDYFRYEAGSAPLEVIKGFCQVISDHKVKQGAA